MKVLSTDRLAYYDAHEFIKEKGLEREFMRWIDAKQN